MENESSITEFVLEPSKTYHIGDGDGFRIYLQVVHFEKEDYSIRVIIGGEDFIPNLSNEDIFGIFNKD